MIISDDKVSKLDALSLNYDQMAAVVNNNITYQTMDGFGATNYGQLVYTSGWAPVADQLFRSDIGLGLSMYNVGLFTDSNGNGWPVYNDSSGNDIPGDFSVEYQIYLRGLRTFMMRCWTPNVISPYTWLTGGSETGTLLLSKYTAMASSMTSFLTNALSAGVPFTHISMMNEPDLTPSGYSQTTWSSTDALNFFDNYLVPACTTWVASNPSWSTMTGLSAIQFIWGETANWADLSTWVGDAEGDSTAVASIKKYSTHQYFGGAVYSPPSPCSHPIWETEVFNQGSQDTTITDGMIIAGYMYNALTTGNVSAWLYWVFEDIGDPDNSGLVGDSRVDTDWNNPSFNKRAYVLGQFAKFIRPGWQRISLTGAPSGVNALAFQDPLRGHIAIVAINTNGSSTSFTANLVNVPSSEIAQPWITSATFSLSQQPSLSISGGSFTYSLASNSVSTFYCPMNLESPNPTVLIASP